MTSADFGAEEGEISEAIPLPRYKQEALVDRVERTRFSRPNDHEHSRDARNYRRSRSPRGFKRPHDDRDRWGDNKYRASELDVQYAGRENLRYGYDENRSSTRQLYRDLDRPQSRGSQTNFEERADNRSGDRSSRNYHPNGHRHEDRHHGYNDDHSKRRRRQRSRSPRNRDDRGRRDRDRDRNDDHASSSSFAKDLVGAQIGSSGAGQYDSKRGQIYSASHQTTKSDHNGRVEQGRNGLSISQASDFEKPTAHDADPDPDFDWDPAQERNKEAEIEAEIERRRRAREAAYKRAVGAATPNIQALQASDRASSTPESTQVNTPAAGKTEVDTPHSVDQGSPMLSPTGFDFGDENGLAKASGGNAGDEAGPSAADYDPTADMKEDERRDEMRHGNVGLHGETRPIHADESTAAASRTQESKQDDDDDVDFDMFAEELDEEALAAASKMQEKAQLGLEQANGGRGGVVDSDDHEGYFKIRIGELLGGHYRIIDSLGKGMFSGVARAEDLKTKKVVAVKIMRNNDALRKGGFTEIAILKKLNSSDPDNKKHIVRFESSFEYKGHLCMVFENLSINLREVIKIYGRETGINLRAVQKYALQIFTALLHMRKCSIIHADLKPDNILVDDSKTLLKICDLGTAIDRSDAATSNTEVTPYLISRFYRAPEIILGIPYDYAVDMWSIGCTLYELYVGKILFTGGTNNQMLKVIQTVRGKIQPKLQKRGELAYNHFDEYGNFVSLEPDPLIDNKINRRVISAFPQNNKLRDQIQAASKDLPENQTKDLVHFVDLVERCLMVNPDKRITPQEALQHPFFHKPGKTEPARVGN
ncbi:Protein kinase-like domain containing protein [Rhypophila decipiens]